MCKIWICGCSLAWDCGFESLRGQECRLIFVCCQMEVSASGLSLIRRSPTECRVSECDSEASIMGRSWGCCATGKELTINSVFKHVGAQWRYSIVIIEYVGSRLSNITTFHTLIFVVQCVLFIPAFSYSKYKKYKNTGRHCVLADINKKH
jgi:hypothetical protein